MASTSAVAVSVAALLLVPAARAEATGAASTQSTAVSQGMKGGGLESVARNEVVQRQVDGRAAPVAEPTPATVAAASPGHLPRTAGALPVLGLLALASAGIALALRATRALR